jgi:uncharacterized protein (DUF2147 family)
MKIPLTGLFLCLTPLFVHAQSSVLGKWKSMDDNSGEPKSIVELVERSGKVYGKVIKIYTKPGQDPDPVCDKCPKEDERFNKKVIGMEIITDLIKEDEAFGSGEILDPEIGKVYRCKIWVEGKILKVRGYFGPFYRTQTWLKVQ